MPQKSLRTLITVMISTLALLLSSQLTSAQAAPVPVDGLPTEVPTMYIDLPPGYDLDYMSESKNNVVPTDPDSEPLATLSVDDAATPANSFTDVALEEVKTRGNWTFTLDKKPFQIKFDKKQSVLGMASAKTWILLANHADTSLVRNKTAYDFARQLGLPNSPDSRFVDLVVNGEYQGNYLITEKVQVGENRLNLQDPAGILVEMDNNYGTAEDWYFTTTRSKTIFTLKDAVSDVADAPDPLSEPVKSAFANIETKLNEFESLLYSSNPDWAKISTLIDVDSFIKYYFVFEVAANPEITQSSVYFWQDGPNDVIHAAPVWDFDSAFASYTVESLGGDPLQDYVKNARFLRNQGNGWYRELFRIPEFVDQVNATYTQSVRPLLLALPDKIDGYAASITSSAAKNFEKWQLLGAESLFVKAGRAGHDVAPTYAGEVSYLKDWVSSRVTSMDKRYGTGMPILRYQAHVAKIGWQNKSIGVNSADIMTSGQIVGTTGQALPVEALNFEVVNNGVSGTVEANAHVTDLGWMGWKSSNPAGTTGRALTLQAVQLRLTGALAAQYDIEYRSHVSEIGWQGWQQNSANSGTTGKNLPIEAIQVRLVLKAEPTEPPAVSASIDYKAHVSTIGWMASFADGADAGTVGKALPVEAIQANVSVSGVTGGIQYRAHVSNIGWQSWETPPAYIGTVGQALPLEAFEITLTGDLAAMYSVRYCAHVRDLGWQPCVSDGQTAGTTGMAKSVEAFRISLIPKN